MCYTGICLFESGWGPRGPGDCTVVGSFEKFEERYGETPCMVGQCPQDPDDAKYMEENRERLNGIYEKYLADRFKRHLPEHALAEAGAS